MRIIIKQTDASYRQLKHQQQQQESKGIMGCRPTAFSQFY